VLNRVTNSDLNEFLAKDGKFYKFCEKIRTEAEAIGLKWGDANVDTANKKTTIQLPAGAHA
jgi:hypothetical protein